MIRGEIWTVAGGVYASKPRPAVIMQDDLFDSTLSVVVCADDEPAHRCALVSDSYPG